MNRTFKPMDVLTLVGIAATIAGIVLCLQALFAPVTFGAHSPGGTAHAPVDMQISLRWIQPLLGQAIVEDALVRQRQGMQFGDVANATSLRGGSPLTEASVYAEAMETDHAARVQWVMGRLIVDLAGQRVRTGGATMDRPANEGDQWIVAVAQQVEAQFHKAFLTARQAWLGRAIVTGALHRARTEHAPDRVGLIF